MKIYLDDDAASQVLTALFIKDGHDVAPPKDVGTAGQKDAAHFIHAIRNSNVLLTHNYDDFELLHTLVRLVNGHHPGILIVRRDNDPTRDMTPKAIARALRRLLASQPSLEDHVHVLNQWR